MVFFVESNNTYKYTHINASAIYREIYYRIKQVDLNGEFTYTPFISVNFDKVLESNEIVVFPNPIINNVKVVIKSSNIKSVALYSSLGELIYIQEHDSPVSNTSVDTSNLESGIYFVKINEKEFRQIIVY